MPGHILDENTIALWPLDEEINHQQTLASYGAAAGVSSQIVFDGVDDQIRMGDVLDFDRLESFTLGIWFATINGSAGTIFSKFDTTLTRGWRVQVNNGGRIDFRLENIDTGPGFNRIVVFTNSTFADGVKRNLIITYDGSSNANGVLIYIDGAPVATTIDTDGNTLTQTTVNAATLQIAGADSAGSFDGIIEHVSAWDKDLSPSEVLQVYGGGTPPDLINTTMGEELVGWWKIDSTDNFTTPGGVDDHSGSNNNGTAFGGFGFYTPNLVRFPNSDVNIPGISGGPLLAGQEGQDNCRWFSQYLNQVRGMTAPANVVAVNTLIGQAWTIEGYIYIDRSPTVIGDEVFIGAYGASGETEATNILLQITINTSRNISIFWEHGAGIDVSATSTGQVPIQQWVHIAIRGVVNGSNRDLSFFIAGASAGTSTGLTKASGGTSGVWIYGVSLASTRQFSGGMAYFRVSRIARSDVEIQDDAGNPTLIINDANTAALWGFQEPPQHRDISPSGLHLTERTLIDGIAPSASPKDVYGISGPSSTFLAKQYFVPASNNASQAQPKQFFVDAIAGLNEYTIETWMRYDSNALAHILFNARGAISNLQADNTVLEFTIQSNNKYLIHYENENGFGWSMTSENTVFPSPANQSGELSTWHHIATRKRNVGNQPFWIFDGDRDGVDFGNAAPLSFNVSSPLTLIIWINCQVSSLQHLMGKTEIDATAAGYELTLDASGRAEFRIENAASGRLTKRVTAASAATSTVKCIAVTYSGNQAFSGINIYYDGVLQAMTNGVDTLAGGSAITAMPFTIGRRGTFDFPYNGYILQASVWNTELSAAEVLEAFGSFGRPPPDLLTTSMAADLVGWWKFDENDGEELTPIWKFDALTYRVSIGNVLNFERTDAFSLVGWGSILVQGTTRHLIAKIGSTTAQLGYALRLTSTGSPDNQLLQFTLNNNVSGGANALTINSTATLTVGMHHMAVTYDGSSTPGGVRLYVDGVLVTQTTVNNTLTLSTLSSESLTLGNRPAADLPFSSEVKHCSIWNKRLSDAEVLETYGGGNPPNLLASSMVANLVGWWKLDDTDNTGASGIIDHSASAFHGTASGGLDKTIPARVLDHSTSGIDGTTVGNLNFVNKPSSEWDLFADGTPLETVGPSPNPVAGDIYAATSLSYINQFHATSTLESRANTRISNIARTDAEIFESFAQGEGSVVYKMRAVDNGRPSPGYIYWTAGFADFSATLIGTANPPLIGTVVPGSVIEISHWIV